MFFVHLDSFSASDSLATSVHTGVESGYNFTPLEPFSAQQWHCLQDPRLFCFSDWVSDQSCETTLPKNHVTRNLATVWADLWKVGVVNSALKEQSATWVQINIHESFKIMIHPFKTQVSTYALYAFLHMHTSFQITQIYKVSNLENKLTHQENSDKFETLKMCWWNTVKRAAVGKTENSNTK